MSNILLPEPVEDARHGDFSMVYKLYGVHLATGFPLRSHLLAGPGPTDLEFSCANEALPISNTCWGEPVGVPDTSGRRPGWVYLDRLGTVDVISYPRIFDFYIWRDRIFCHLKNRDYSGKVEIALLGTVLAYWLERSGVPTLHASAVEIDGQAVAFLANNKGGKTSLAVTLMQAGCPLITDDILPLECNEGIVYGRRGYPQLRLWPDQAASLLGECDHLEFIHPAIPKYRVPVGDQFSAFSDGSKPLRCIYLPERRETNGTKRTSAQIEITSLHPRDSLKELLSKTFEPMLAEAAGLRGRRLSFFGSLLQQTPIRRLRYPDGVEYLPAVGNAILEDIAGLRATERKKLTESIC